MSMSSWPLTMNPVIQVIMASATLVIVKILVDLLSTNFRSPMKNLSGPPSPSWLRGHMDQLFHPQGWDFHLKTVVSFGTAVRLRGFLGEDVLYLTDPAGLRTVLIREHGDIYEEPPMIIERNNLLWGPGLLSSTGMAHKKQRYVINTAFSIQRMRLAMPIFWEVTHRVEETLLKSLRNGSTELDMLVWMSRVSSELIGQAGIGKSFDTLAEVSAPNEYMFAAKQLIPLSFPLQDFMRLIPYIVKFGSPNFRGFLAKIAPHPNIRKLREIIYFLHNTNSSIYRERIQSLEQESKGDGADGPRRDIISVLIQNNKGVDEANRLSDDEIISQMGTLIFAGQHTTSVALSRILQVLSLDLKRQEKLRLELINARAEGQDLSYDDLMALPYLDAVCKETLRLYAPAPQLHRVPSKDTSVPLSRPVLGKDGSTIDRIHVRAGTMVVIGAAAVNRDPIIWGPDAEKWIPERWLEPLPETLNSAYLPGVYSNMMTFMGGGRSCIGFKFAETEIKAVLYVLLSRMKFEPSNTPIEWNMFNFATPTVKGDSTKPSMPLKVTLLSG
ncbi:cytochrome P450 [Multifurca ochricompacta]|uniref:Cytochrome P450 n=1 Tax=Multifurca ochricompacta TaxID=376703 RepID=A0AAD4M0Z7_9AGAM|nr:cytochrome P450 [Multifurca ochricompacta]KAI0295412.1 cytochrome P450 [Multifurca ochricompacta]